MNAARTYRKHVTARANLRQQRTVRLSDEAAAKLAAWRAGRVELTPPTRTSAHYEWGTAEKGRGEDDHISR